MRGLGLLLCVLVGIAAVVLWKGREPAAPRQPEEPGGAEAEDARFAKVHFMREFVAALTEPPGNLMPQPSYAPLLKEGAALVRCADCHKSMDVEAMIANDPGDEAAQPFRMDRKGFMIPLMEKWVARLNKRHADRLRKEVTCTDCHARDPRDDDARIPFLMMRFVQALESPPQNRNPAQGWKPLLKDPGTASMLCATCHEEIGAEMERNLAQFKGPPPPTAWDRTFMIRLMERWVRELNRKMKDRLVKAVGCTDCHEIDPRK